MHNRKFVIERGCRKYNKHCLILERYEIEVWRGQELPLGDWLGTKHPYLPEMYSFPLENGLDSNFLILIMVSFGEVPNRQCYSLLVSSPRVKYLNRVDEMN